MIAEDIYPPKIDWKLILEDLRDHGCSGYRVAKVLDVQWSSVHYWIHCRKPPELDYGIGRALLLLHARYCGAALTLRRQAEAEKKSQDMPTHRLTCIAQSD